MNKEKILNLLKEIENELNKKEKIKLEPKNFKINSDGWEKELKDGVEYLENETGDVWELLSNGEQLFTREAAIRETKKAGKRMPTYEEFELLNKEDFGEIIYTGYRFMNNSFGGLGKLAQFWSSTESGTSSWDRQFYSSDSPGGIFAEDKDYSFSVRCVKE